ncbi:hypothetical protein AB3N02_21790 [Priestia aryabhattai]|uniref:hypothetical protein n=1 Tax=Priestia aryabhattai TaxID=412384 RepID=UPI0039A36B45
MNIEIEAPKVKVRPIPEIGDFIQTKDYLLLIAKRIVEFDDDSYTIDGVTLVNLTHEAVTVLDFKYPKEAVDHYVEKGEFVKLIKAHNVTLTVKDDE